MYQSERMSCVRVTCLATGNQIYEWSQHIFKNLCKCVFEIFCFQTFILVYFQGVFLLQKKSKERKTILT